MLDVVELYCLRHLKRATSPEIIELQFQEMILNGILKVNIVNIRRGRRFHKRHTYSYGPKFDSIFNLEASQRVLIQPLLHKDDMDLTEVKVHLDKVFKGDLQHYYNHYIFPELRKKGLVSVLNYRTSLGKREYRESMRNIRNVKKAFHVHRPTLKDLHPTMDLIKSNILMIPNFRGIIEQNYPYIFDVYLNRFID